MLQPLAVRRDPQAWLTPFELQETMDRLKDLIERASPARFPVKAGEGWVFLDLRKVTHFEVAHEIVHVWAGQRFRTSWTTAGINPRSSKFKSPCQTRPAGLRLMTDTGAPPDLFGSGSPWHRIP